MKPIAHAVLNLEAAAHNLAIARQHAVGARIMAVIKANGYGHGSIRIAEALQNVDAFAVARVDEGIRLRNAGIQHRIAVLEGFTTAEELDLFIEYQLEAIVHTASQLTLIEGRAGEPVLPVWLKIDTGMNRLGFKNHEFAQAYLRLTQAGMVKLPIGIMTHLANADDLADTKTLKQIELFRQTVKGLSEPLSIANSAGILGWPQSLVDWVRPGVMLYGISPFPDKTGAELGLKPIMELRSQVIAVKPLLKGETAGYGSKWTCPADTIMGVVAIGYGDGYPRYARPGTPVLIGGQRAPLIGRVSMDMITVDLGNHPDVKPGDPVVLWGEGLPVEEIARCADTIPYTLVCGITPRVQIVEQAGHVN